MELPQLPLLGEAACLVSAALWALAVTLFRPAIERHGARCVNFAKCSLAAVLQGLTVWALGLSADWSALGAAAFGWIAASGFAGLVVGDTALFSAVGLIGVQRTLLLQTLSPVFAALLAWAAIGEVPRAWQAVGAAIILGGIALVVGGTRRRAAGARLPPAGVAVGLLAALAQGTGIVLAKLGMQEIPVLAASALRLAVAAVGLGLLLLLRGQTTRLGRLLRDPLMARRVLPATLVGTYLAMFLFMGGIHLAPAAVAAVLIGTTPVFGLILDAARERRLPAWRRLAGTLLAVAGVALLSLS